MENTPENLPFISEEMKNDDYRIFSDQERNDLIVKYTLFIQEQLSFHPRPVTVFMKKDPYGFYSFRGMFEFEKRIEEPRGPKRKHTSFFEARNFSDFSLKKFKEDVVDSKEKSTVDDFKKALYIRIWNTGFTDEEILCALLPNHRELVVSDLWRDNTLTIPPEFIDELFNEMNFKGGYPTSSRIKRVSGNTGTKG